MKPGNHPRNHLSASDREPLAGTTGDDRSAEAGTTSGTTGNHPHWADREPVPPPKGGTGPEPWPEPKETGRPLTGCLPNRDDRPATMPAPHLGVRDGVRPRLSASGSGSECASHLFVGAC